MADWTDPQTWRDAKRYAPVLDELAKKLNEAKRQGGQPAVLELVEQVLAVLQGHQKTLVDVSHVAGKLVTYVTAAHEQKAGEIATLRELVKSVRQLEKISTRLAKRVNKLEERAKPKSR